MRRNINMETEQINNLLAKHFAKETSAEEELIVREWIKKNPEEYLSMKVLWADSSVVPERQLFALETAWHKVEDKIGARNAPASSLKRYGKINYWIAAAAMLLITGTSIFFYITSLVTVTTQSNQVKNITLSDGTSIALNGNSTISYPRYFISKRDVNLDGEAFFDVEHDAKKPFVVHTKQLLVTVLGTSFLVNSSEKGMGVKVKTGKVAVKDELSKRRLVLLPGEGAQFVSGFLQKEILKNENYLAWKTKELVFKDIPLNEVFSTLENYYRVSIVTKGADSYTCKVTTQFKNESLDDVLKELSLLFGFNYQIKENKVSISGIMCP